MDGNAGSKRSEDASCKGLNGRMDGRIGKHAANGPDAGLTAINSRLQR